MAKDTAGCRALNRNYIVGGDLYAAQRTQLQSSLFAVKLFLKVLVEIFRELFPLVKLPFVELALVEL